MATPMQEQYLALKKKYSDSILLFRLGDFYEGFSEDAQLLSKVLGLTLTGRGEGSNRVPMAGIPHHALKNYLPKLIKAGYKVAIADQLEEPVPGQLVERDVTKVITAGTIIDENDMDPDRNNYIASIYLSRIKGHQYWGLAYSDITTGEFLVSDYLLKQVNQSLPANLVLDLFRIDPKEIIVPSSLLSNLKNDFPSYNFIKFDDREYFPNELKNDLLEYFQAASFKSFGLDDLEPSLIAAGKLLEYVKNNRKGTTPKLKQLKRIQSDDLMYLDDSTIRSLELIYPLRGNDISKTLYGVLDQAQTAMGKRLLRNWILHPLIRKDLIEKRYYCVEQFFKNEQLAKETGELLTNISDLERILIRLSGKSANARDLQFLANSVSASLKILDLKGIAEVVKSLDNNIPTNISSSLNSELVEYISKAIKDDPALTITQGDMIREGFDKDLDEIRQTADSGKVFLKQLEEKEIKQTGISSLKVRFNKVFGYYIEVSKSNLNKVPAHYIRKQTLVNAERYITEELKVWEEKILNSSELIAQREYQLFETIRENVLRYFNDVMQLASLIAHIDLFVNFAKIAKLRNYIKPSLEDPGEQSYIINGRHPVVESFLKDDFIPNDISFKPGTQELILLTGPNMSGKSTYIRQVALIYLMAQIGSFIPASDAKISIVDRIFTRVGASDDLAGGESTFMVEMLETANILNNATNNSLLILDEVGRGTSTYDGMALAWAIIEQIVKDIKAKCLFATHYHDLLLLEDLHPMVKNFKVSVLETKDEVSFMHKIEKGGIDKSFGIHVAKLAGIPPKTIKRANQILDELHKKSIKSFIEKHKLIDTQLGFNVEPATLQNPVLNELNELDINTLSPLAALNKLQEIKKKLSNEGN